MPVSSSATKANTLAGALDDIGSSQQEFTSLSQGLERQLHAYKVDVAKAIWTNTIGAPELIAVWQDPEFDAQQSAFYYGRVIEIPTPRWTAYDAYRFGITMPPEVEMKHQERAWTSPIWYTPAAKSSI